MGIINEREVITNTILYSFATGHNRHTYDSISLSDPDNNLPKIFKKIAWSITGIQTFIDHLLIAGPLKNLNKFHSNK